ncbi:MAG: VOC family protein [Spirochaetaceae bacterium]|nr:MAG: VOC family protein [Spirochaetaceae bacterium]
MNIQGFHHVAIRTRNFDRSLHFYQSVFGFETSVSWGTPGARAAMLSVGSGGHIEIFERPSETWDSEAAMLHLALRTDSCDEYTERARAAGAEVTKEPKDVDIPSDPVYPVRISFFKGPDGEIVELFQER